MLKFLLSPATIAAAVLFGSTIVQALPSTLVCPPNSAVVANKCVCNAATYYSGGTNGDGSLKRCYKICPTNYYPRLDNVGFPINDECVKCPTYSASTGRQSSCACIAGHDRLTTTAAGQTNLCACPANAVRATSSSACGCKTGFYKRGTYADGTLRTCLPDCPVNQYPVLSGDGKPLGTCTTCPARSTSTGFTFQCTCDPETFKLSTTPAGQTRTCSICPRDYPESDDGRTCLGGGLEPIPVEDIR